MKNTKPELPYTAVDRRQEQKVSKVIAMDTYRGLPDYIVMFNLMLTSNTHDTTCHGSVVVSRFLVSNQILNAQYMHCNHSRDYSIGTVDYHGLYVIRKHVRLTFTIL